MTNLELTQVALGILGIILIIVVDRIRKELVKIRIELSRGK